jgi:addiction module HigA family antidote
MREKKVAPIHPGEVLLEDFMRPLGISQYRLAKAMHVYPRKINEIVQGKRSITADTALRLARFFGTSAEVWMNLQALYDLEVAKDDLEETIERDVTPYLGAQQATILPAGA